MNRSSVKVLIVIALGVALVGCAKDRRDTPPPVREVKIPVLVRCEADIPARPAFAVDALPLGADVWQQMAALRAERKQRSGYEAELEASLQECVGAPELDQEKQPP